ncbi:hypothetical protein D3Z62_20100 [Lachnospiraceae bacterium]|nr:hypothetical protein [Lachnospiraceae bacterium]
MILPASLLFSKMLTGPAVFSIIETMMNGAKRPFFAEQRMKAAGKVKRVQETDRGKGRWIWG